MKPRSVKLEETLKAGEHTISMRQTEGGTDTWSRGRRLPAPTGFSYPGSNPPPLRLVLWRG